MQLQNAFTDDLARLDPPPDRGEELELVERAQGGDARARDELVSRHLPFVLSYARPFQGQGVEPADLVAAGVVGLLHALPKYDPDTGVRFLSYGVHWIKATILREVAEQGRPVRIPLNRNATLSRLVRARDRLVQRGLDPTSARLAREVGVGVEAAGELERLDSVTRLDAAAAEDDGRTARDFLPAGTPGPDVEAAEVEVAEVIERALSGLPPRERLVVSLYYGLDGPPLTTGQVAGVLGVSGQRVRVILDDALDALRSGPHAHALRAVARDLGAGKVIS